MKTKNLFSILSIAALLLTSFTVDARDRNRDRDRDRHNEGKAIGTILGVVGGAVIADSHNMNTAETLGTIAISGMTGRILGDLVDDSNDRDGRGYNHGYDNYNRRPGRGNGYGYGYQRPRPYRRFVCVAFVDQWGRPMNSVVDRRYNRILAFYGWDVHNCQMHARNLNYRSYGY